MNKISTSRKVDSKQIDSEDLPEKEVIPVKVIVSDKDIKKKEFLGTNDRDYKR